MIRRPLARTIPYIQHTTHRAPVVSYSIYRVKKKHRLEKPDFKFHVYTYICISHCIRRVSSVSFPSDPPTRAIDCSETERRAACDEQRFAKEKYIGICLRIVASSRRRTVAPSHRFRMLSHIYSLPISIRKHRHDPISSATRN